MGGHEILPSRPPLPDNHRGGPEPLNHGNYEPTNCIWATSEIQNKHKRNVRFLEVNGVRKPIWQWAEETGVSSRLIKKRIDKGWDAEMAISLPPQTRAYYSGEFKVPK